MYDPARATNDGVREGVVRCGTHRWMLLHEELPVLEEIGLEDLVGSMLSLQQSSKPASELLGLGRKVDRFTYMHND